MQKKLVKTFVDFFENQNDAFELKPRNYDSYKTEKKSSTRSKRLTEIESDERDRLRFRLLCRTERAKNWQNSIP